jgi:hypothetical protein
MIDPWIYVYNQPIDGKDKIEEPSYHEYKRKREKPELSVERSRRRIKEKSLVVFPGGDVENYRVKHPSIVKSQRRTPFDLI